MGLQNAKYSEFVGKNDWDHLLTPLEYELFDLDADPWELKNVFASASAAVKLDLHNRVEKLFRCKGVDCN